jgi:hypothetical protein
MWSFWSLLVVVAVELPHLVRLVEAVLAQVDCLLAFLV